VINTAVAEEEAEGGAGRGRGGGVVHETVLYF